MSEPTVLIVEDGDEYRDSLSRYVLGAQYLQAHSGGEALALLERAHVDVLYLDMRFDRIPHDLLLGDHEAATREHSGDPTRGWRYLEENQGLFILAAVKERFPDLPVIIAFDFSRAQRRLMHLRSRYTRIEWVGEDVTPLQIRELIERSCGASR